MKLLRIKAIAQKEILQIRRDPLSLAMAFLMPVLLLLIFGYAITLDVNNLTTIVYDADRSRISRELVAELTSSGYFSVVRQAESQREIDQLKVFAAVPCNIREPPSEIVWVLPLSKDTVLPALALSLLMVSPYHVFDPDMV